MIYYTFRNVPRDLPPPKAHRVLLSLSHFILVLSLIVSAPLETEMSHRGKVWASSPDRLFLPIGAEIQILTDLMNLFHFIGERSYLEPWRSLHPPLSSGRPGKGRLLNGYKMQSALGLHVIEPEDSYTTYEVALTLYALNLLVRRAHPDGADLMVLDIAQESGGLFKPHRSHQNGADVDLRYYLKGVPPNSHEKIHVHPSKLDFPRMWTFLFLLSHYDLSDIVFMDLSLQRMLYQYGEKKLKLTKRDLAKYLSYPAKSRSGALVKHINGHYNHMHVRFKLGPSLAWRTLSLNDIDSLHTQYLQNRTGFFEYTVQPGQTLGYISKFNRVRLKDLLKWNELTPTSIIRPGQVLKVWR